MAVATEKDAGVPNSVLEVPLIDQLSNPAVQALVAEAAPQGDD